MITFDEAAVILDDLIEELPDGIYDGLNGGVNLIEESKKNDYGDYLMGLYHVNEMGRYIEIFYGSFVELYGDMDQDSFTRELRKVLHHELTHHVENLAGDRTLEKWDEEQAEKRQWGYVDADRIMFIDDDGSALAVMAEAMFHRYSQSKCGGVTVAAASLDDFAGRLNKDASEAAMEAGIDMSAECAPIKARDTELKDYGALLCMTMVQADALYAKFPQFDERIMCLGATDIKPPLFKKGWKKVVKRMEDEIKSLVDELDEREK